MNKKFYIYGNWKMNLGPAEAADYGRCLAALLDEHPLENSVSLGLFPPALSLAALSKELKNVTLGLQDVSCHPSGAYTGELSVAMLREAGCSHALVGHSERRQYHGETSQLVAQKARACVEGGLIPVVCIGETLQQREAGQVFSVIEEQLAPVKAALPDDAQWLVAYEPVWAIGTGRTASALDAAAACAFAEKLAHVPVLYGGSVKESNAAELFAQSHVSGALIGGASLKPKEFFAIAQAASSVK